MFRNIFKGCTQTTMHCIMNYEFMLLSYILFYNATYCRATTRFEHVEGDEEEEVAVDGEDEEEKEVDGEEEEVAADEGLAAEEGMPDRKRPRLGSFD